MDEEVDRSEEIASFCAIVGCPDHVAVHYLDACGYNLDRAIDFYYQNPPDLPGGSLHSHEDLPVEGGDEDMQQALAASLNPHGEH